MILILFGVSGAGKTTIGNLLSTWLDGASRMATIVTLWRTGGRWSPALSLQTKIASRGSMSCMCACTSS